MNIITNKEYREINPKISDRTALNDLNDLVKKGIIAAKGGKNIGIIYFDNFG